MVRNVQASVISRNFLEMRIQQGRGSASLESCVEQEPAANRFDRHYLAPLA